jgi:sarcosine oxidase subunit beta
VPDRVAVVGAGVIGAATALELARAGADVVLLEAGSIAAGVTGGSLAALTRHLTSDPDELPLVLESTDRWTALAEEFRDTVGIDIEHEVCGHLALIEADSSEQAAETIAGVCTILDREREHGMTSEYLTAAQARERLPALAGARVVAASWGAEDAKINPLLACRAMVHAAVAAGAEVRTGCRVIGIAPANGRWRLTAVGEAVEADAVVVACGPWTGSMLARHEPRLAEAIRPHRAQCAVTESRPPTIGPIVSSTTMGVTSGYTQLHQTRHGEVMFNTVVETADPHLVDGQFDAQVDHHFLVASSETLVDLFPELADARLLRSWAACEAWTADNRFVIGPVGDEDGLYVAAGDCGVGFIKAPVVARIVTSLIRGGDCGYDRSRYALDRPTLEGAAR